jgi:hypothetical protein
MSLKEDDNKRRKERRDSVASELMFYGELGHDESGGTTWSRSLLFQSLF